MSAPTVFLSAVTKDYGLLFLEELRRKIQHPGIACRFRGNLEQSGKLLPEKLRDEIEAASCVIHLVGPSFGFGAADVMVPDLESTPAGEYWKPACRAWWPLGGFPARRSYTQMELDFAIQLRRPVYVLFVDDPAVIAAASQPPAEAQLQKAHREAIESRGHEWGKVESIARLDDIITRLPIITDYLREKIRALEKEKSALAQKNADAAKEVRDRLPPPPPFDLDAYAERLRQHCLRIPLTDKFGSGGMEQLTLRAVFVEPWVRLYPLRDPKEIELPAEAREAALRGEIDHLPRRQREKAEHYQKLHREQPRAMAAKVILDATHRGHIVLGDAGLGKTSLVRHIALEWADAWLKSPAAAAALPIPLYIELKSYATATGQQISLSLLDYLQQSQHGIHRLPQNECAERLANGRAFLILDALDEVADAAIQRAIAKQADELLRGGACVLLTSRASGFAWENWPEDGTWRCWLLQEFEKEERQSFLEKAAPLLWTSENERIQRIADLGRRLGNFPAIERLARNPLLLTLIVLMHRNNRLGESRVAIYSEASEWLLDRWEELHQEKSAIAVPVPAFAVPAITKRRIVRRLARRIYESNLAARLGENIFPLSLLQDVIREIVDPTGSNPVHADLLAERLPNILRDRHSVLCWAGGQDYSFVHRSFLEFFTAEAWASERDLARLDPGQVRSELLEKSDRGQLPHWRDPRYENIIPLYFGLLSEDRAAERLPLLLELRDSEFPRSEVNLAAACFSEVQEKSLHASFAAALEKRLIAIAGSEWSYIEEFLEVMEANRSIHRRAVESIAQLFASPRDGHPWLWRALGNKDQHWAVRQEICIQLGLVLGKNKELRTRLEQIIASSEEVKDIRTQAIRTLAGVWGRAEGLRELLREILGRGDEDPNVVATAREWLERLWPE